MRLLEDIIPIPFAGRFQGSDRGKQAPRGVIESQPFRITNAVDQTGIRALEALAHQKRELASLRLGTGDRLFEL